MQRLKQNILRLLLFSWIMLCVEALENEDDGAFSEAMDLTLSFLSKSGSPSNNSHCAQNMKELMTRNGILPSAAYLKNNMTDSQLLRLGLLASIALISPWNQDAQGKFSITDRGILVEDYHPSSAESDIMLCVVCTLLAIIVLFHVTSAQQQYVFAPAAIVNKN
jgi:hypothetical protein